MGYYPLKSFFDLSEIFRICSQISELQNEPPNNCHLQYLILGKILKKLNFFEKIFLTSKDNFFSNILDIPKLEVHSVALTIVSSPAKFLENR